VTVGVSLTCQSSLFDATDPVFGLLEYGGSTMTGLTISTAVMDAGEERAVSTTFDLPVDLTTSPVSLYIGNNFTGYVHLRLSLGAAPPFDLLPIVAVAGVALVAIVIVFIWKKT
jgi:hypothetical protein